MALLSFIHFNKTGYERICVKCNKKNSQLRGAANRRAKHKPAWNRGLTQETSEAVARSTQGCKNYIAKHGHWRTGQTKENNEAVARAAEKISIAQKQRWANGTHGMIGKNGSNHEGIRKRGLEISRVFLETDKHWSHKADSVDVIKRAIATRRERIISGELSPYRMPASLIQQRLDLISESWIINDDFVYAGAGMLLKVTCKACNHTDALRFNSLYKGKLCPKCFPANFSKWHRDLYDYMLTLDPNATVNDRTAISPLELDVVSSNRKFAIECNGLYWHSDVMDIEPGYHQFKSMKAQKYGISLLHVFEDEWYDDLKREIIKSMIRVKLGLANKYMARKLTLHVGHPTNVAGFMTQNHLDGNTPASKAFWLTNESGDIICALTLRKPHQQAKWGAKTIELARIATVKDCVVAGGMSRLIVAAINWAKQQGYEKVLTYRDIRLGGTGQAYEQSGFKLSHLTSPRFWWTDFVYRIDRFAVRAIPGIATQEDMAMEHRLFKIFGCSNAVYTLNIA